MDFDELVAGLRDRPGMYGVDDSFCQACVYLQATTYALDGGPLKGLQEWLVVRHSGGDNLAWWALVLRIAFDESALHLPDRLKELSAEDDAHARRTLFQLVTEFRAMTKQSRGTAAIYDAYAQWLRQQTWGADALPPVVEAPRPARGGPAD